MTELFEKRILSVSEITFSIKGILETSFAFVSVKGEVSNLRQPLSGHLYFTLKDDKAQLKAVCFKQQQRYLEKLPKEGQLIVCRGRLSVYEPRGEYQLIVDYLQEGGAGPQQILFEQLKKKLSLEGLFDQEHKKKIPALPGRITLVTSPDGAALYDFLKVAKLKHPSIAIEIFPVRVQGKEATHDIIEALTLINERNISEVIIICRGGGSIEDLSIFNEENLARAIFDSEIPVVSAVGHEIDFTIADFVADHRSPTPSAAADEIVPDKKRLEKAINDLLEKATLKIKGLINTNFSILRLYQRMLGDPRSNLEYYMLHLDAMRSSLLHGLSNNVRRHQKQLSDLTNRLNKQNPSHHLHYNKKWLREQARQLCILMELHLSKKKRSLDANRSILNAFNPRQVLHRGYSIIRDKKTLNLVNSCSQLSVGQDLDLMVTDGVAGCRVTDINEE